MLFSIHLREEALASWPVRTEIPGPQPELLAGALAIQLAQGGAGVSKVKLMPAYEVGNTHEEDLIVFHLVPRANSEYGEVIDHIVDTVFSYIKPDYDSVDRSA